MRIANLTETVQEFIRQLPEGVIYIQDRGHYNSWIEKHIMPDDNTYVIVRVSYFENGGVYKYPADAITIGERNGSVYVEADPDTATVLVDPENYLVTMDDGRRGIPLRNCKAYYDAIDATGYVSEDDWHTIDNFYRIAW